LQNLMGIKLIKNGCIFYSWIFKNYFIYLIYHAHNLSTPKLECHSWMFPNYLECKPKFETFHWMFLPIEKWTLQKCYMSKRNRTSHGRWSINKISFQVSQMVRGWTCDIKITGLGPINKNSQIWEIFRKSQKI
jgi:hypothetical protein